MIVLTADIHNRLPNAWVQRQAEAHEVILGNKYADIALEQGLKATFFIAGKALLEMPEACDYLREKDIEVGGHTWSSFYPSWPYRASKLLCGRYSGYPALQERHIRRVSQAIRAALGRTMTSWRGHGYIGDDVTYKVLAKNGVIAVSDEVGPGRAMREVNGLISLPINVVPDHEYLKEITRGRFNPCGIPNPKRGIRAYLRHVIATDKSRYFRLAPFSDRALDREAWFKMLREHVEGNISKSLDSVLLIHPVTMEALDGMKTFKKIVQFLASVGEPFSTATEAAALARNK